MLSRRNLLITPTSVPSKTLPLVVVAVGQDAAVDVGLTRVAVLLSDMTNWPTAV